MPAARLPSSEPVAAPQAEGAAGPDWRPAHAFWWLLAASALAGALSEVGVILGARIVLHRYTLLNPHGVWLAPLANAAFLAVPLGVAWLLARRWGVRASIGAMVFVAALAAIAEPLMVLGDRLHPIALLVLSLGLASQAVRLQRARPALFVRFLRGGTLAMLGASVLGGAGYSGQRWWRERRAEAGLGEAPAGAPNVILLVLDTVRALSLSAYGYDRETSPFLAELAAQGVRFDRAISTAPWTLPSHATMFTGRYPHELSSGWSTPLDAQFPTLAERLGARGYLTLGVAANLRYCSYEFGLSRGFAWYRDYDISVSEALRTSQLVHSAVGLFNRIAGTQLSPGRQRARRINERLLALLDQRGEHPFFAFANYYDAHSTYSPEAPFDTLYLGRQPITRDPSGDLYSPEETHDLKAAYDASIASLDAALRDLFRQLRARGLLENTMVIVTADHGEEFNEHGLMNHGSSLYFPSVHVPLLIIQPGVVPASLVIGEPVTIRDIPSTILHAARVPDEDMLPGSSLARWWRNGAGRNDSLPSPLIAEVDFARNLPARFAVSKGDMRSTVVDGYRYLLRGDGQGEMFDVRTDPWEQHDLASDSAYSSRVANLRALVEAIPKRSAARH